MLLSSLLAGLCKITLPTDVDIIDLSLDTRSIKPGALFFALPGTNLDGRKFIDEALQKGAAAILVDGESQITEQTNKLVISIPQLKNLMAEIAARFYGHPTKSLRIIGITGTSGKTSCSQFIAAALSQLKIPCGVIGTLGNGLYGHLKTSGLTTPDVITLQKTFAEFVQQGAKVVAMEVSSHSLDQGRVNGIEFDIGIFTNLSRDHLDYHETMEKYGAAKKKIFAQSKIAVINVDDQFGKELVASLFSQQKVLAYSTTKVADIFADQIKLDHSGIHAHLTTPWGKGELQANLLGQFNLSNLLAVVSALCLLDISLPSVLDAISHFQSVPGRMQVLGGHDKPLVVVDYAHKPDALEKVLIALRGHCTGKLYCVFGCGGERDRGKRPIMAKLAEQYADHVVVTDDNPRHEDPKQIVQDILRGFIHPEKIIVEHNRSKAIHNVIHYATKGDCVLIAGKGAETYQQIGDEKFPFNDVEKVKETLFDARLAE